MKKCLRIMGFALLTLSSMLVVAQKPAKKRSDVPPSPTAEIRVPIDATAWPIQAGQVELTTFRDVPAVHILPKAKTVPVSSVTFANGTIEYDIVPEDPRFAGIYFRRQDSTESEYMYFRITQLGQPAMMDAIQYAPYQKGVLIWDLLDQFQAPVPVFRKGDWNHVKLVVSGVQMLVYVNDMQRPVLEVPRLEADAKQGELAFEGAGYIANVVVKPNLTEGLPATEGYDPTRRDPRYVRTWQVSQPQPLPMGQEVMPTHLPKPETTWQPLLAERYGLVNLTRQYGKSEERRLVWLRTKFKASAEQKRRVVIGFSDDVWVFANGQPVYFDKNMYTAPGLRKTPDGRISIENGTFDLPLKAGDNELVIGVANNFFGWGLIVRLDSMEGVEVIP
ncbi:hypothetical protein [Spirosoma montaniterrae]|nr:hypothetical protein [Spirosoma montaniterrae]